MHNLQLLSICKLYEGKIELLKKIEDKSQEWKTKIISSFSGILSTNAGNYEDKEEFIRKEVLSEEFEYEIWIENYSVKAQTFLWWKSNKSRGFTLLAVN